MRFKALAAMLTFATVILLLTGAGEEPPHTEARIRLVSTVGPLLGFGYRQDREIVPVTISPDYLTAEIVYHGPPRFDLVPLPPPGPDGRIPKAPPRGRKDAPPPMAWFDLPPGPGPCTVILLVTPGERMQVIPDEPGMFPYGSMRVQNLCPYQIAIELPGETTKIAPGAYAIIRPPANGGKGTTGNILSYEDGEERPGYALNLFPTNSRRHLCTVTPGRRHSGLLKFQMIEDSLVEKPPAPSPGAPGEGTPLPVRKNSTAAVPGKAEKKR